MGIAVLDVGTSSMRGILYTNQGKKQFTRQISYSPLYLGDGCVEQKPAVWDNAMAQIMRACAQKAEEEKRENYPNTVIFAKQDKKEELALVEVKTEKWYEKVIAFFRKWRRKDNT